MASTDPSSTSLHVNAFAMHRAEVLMRQRRQLRPRHTTLVSFAAKYHYVETQRRLAAAAAATGDFDTIESWSPDRLRETPYYQAYREILDRSRGAGNWAWKPYIIAEALKRRRDGDFIVFTDTSMQAIGDDPMPPVAPLLTWLAGSERQVAVGVLHGKLQRAWTKRDCFVLMECDSERYWDADQIQATWIAFMVSPATRHLVAERLRYASDARVVTDRPNQMGLPDLDGFIDHRFDQSILSNLIYKLDLQIAPLRQPSKQIRTLIEALETDTLLREHSARPDLDGRVPPRPGRGRTGSTGNAPSAIRRSSSTRRSSRPTRSSSISAPSRASRRSGSTTAGGNSASERS